MKTLFCCSSDYRDESSGDEVEDDDAVGLSHVGTAAYDVLRKHHNRQHHSLWNVTSGQVVGPLQQTPLPKSVEFSSTGHSDWFPETMAEILSRTEIWADVMSLSPPDGVFMEKFQDALAKVAERSKTCDKPITIRMMFGNIVGMPVNCTKVVEKLTKKLPEDANIQLWVGAWRRAVSWNHAKLIAVDGKYLHTGGHNMWDYHYLKNNPVHDLSLELKGRCAHDGHLFANHQWHFVELIQSTTCCGRCIDKIPDGMPLIIKSRVTVTEYPAGISEFPPMYHKRFTPKYDPPEEDIPIITMGRYGSLLRYFRPSDDAIVAMIDSATTVIRLALQDLGPVCVPGTKITVPGCVWPKEYLSALGRAIWTRGVDVEIILSNPGSVPGDLKPTEAQYGNGWSCVDVSAEIIKTIRTQFPKASDDELRKKVAENLRVCFLRREGGLNTWDSGMTLGMHAKHFIVDDVCTYIGSQNLYVCDLAEWGVVIDHEEQVRKIKEEYWDPLWKCSFTGEDVDVQLVMDGLDIDRNGETHLITMPGDKRAQMMAAARMTGMAKLTVENEDLYMDETSVDEGV